MTDILHYTGTNPEEKKKIETEQEAWRTINAFLADERKAFAQALKSLEEKDKLIEELKRRLGEN